MLAETDPETVIVTTVDSTHDQFIIAAMEAGCDERLKLYQLYHVLNHLNLFGRAYHGRAMQLIRDLNACL